MYSVHIHTSVVSEMSPGDVYVSPELRSIHVLHSDVLAGSGASLALVPESRTVLTHCSYQADVLGAQTL